MMNQALGLRCWVGSWVSPDGKKTIGAINERWQKREENKRGVGPRRGDRAGVVWPAKPQNE